MSGTKDIITILRDGGLYWEGNRGWDSSKVIIKSLLSWYLISRRAFSPTRLPCLVGIKLVKGGAQCCDPNALAGVIHGSDVVNLGLCLLSCPLANYVHWYLLPTAAASNLWTRSSTTNWNSTIRLSDGLFLSALSRTWWPFHHVALIYSEGFMTCLIPSLEGILPSWPTGLSRLTKIF